ncbi:acyltransferase [Tunturiibacter empetritectus]|uniref:Peptidoglycan/LPS O-acetylase OafA/YrhL n=1 Tax=Tunturiibacter lichenicola TaxID=2051959 RepID=A0A852VIC3_9BACT|nr:acyltransferase [Edaphobacter lichenicola]NYF90859.1 peptidoglycan/LPS O-acetylase OafA/YrhL [Edaphobacter lichenicola]
MSRDEQGSNLRVGRQASLIWSRLDGVDLLRGVAICMVLMNHVNMRLLGANVPYTDGLPRQLVSSLVWNGQFGVQIFFVISGFLITSTTLRRWGSVSAVNVGDFYRLRFARIAPLMVLVLVILSLLHFAGVKDFVVYRKTGGLGRALVAALTFHVNLLEARRGYLPASWDILWSLSVEEMFYLGFPLACRVFRRVSLLSALLFVFVLLGPFARSQPFNHNPVWREYSYLGGMDAIALGCLTALLSAKARLSSTTLRVLGTAGMMMLVFVLCFSVIAHRWGLGRTGLDMTVLGLGVCMMLVVVAQTRWQAPRSLGPMVLMGRLSYEVYLTHVFVVLSLFHLFLIVDKPVRAVPVMFLAVLLLSGALGAFVSRGYSEPMNRWLRARWVKDETRVGSVLQAEAMIVKSNDVLSL